MDRERASFEERKALEERIASLEVQLAAALDRIAELQTENTRLREELAEAERAAKRQAAPFRRPAGKKVSPQERKRPGRPEGHAGSCRAVPDHVDEQVVVPLPCCPQCGGAVGDVRPLEQYVEDLPPVRPHVTKLTTHVGWCPHCQAEVRSTHPRQVSVAGGAAKVHLGARALSLAAWLNKGLGLTMRKTCTVLGRWGLRITAGGLSQALDRVAERVASEYDRLVEDVRGSAAVHTDETSWWVGGPGWWLWTFTTPETTLYRVEESRGSAVVGETLGAEFAGVLVSDCLASYDPIACRKQKCVAHHLRAIAEARERPDTPDPAYLDQWRLLFKVTCALWTSRTHMPASAFERERDRVAAWCERLILQPVCQPGDVAVRHRLEKQWPHLLTCLWEPAAEPTNNRAERALRPAVIARKLSCGNRTLRGRRTWEVLASLAATLPQRGLDLVQHLTTTLPLDQARPATG